MLTRIQLTLIAALILGVALLVVAIRGEQPTIAAVIASFGIVVAVASGAVFLLDRYAWWWRVLRGWLVKRPDLRGTWKTTLHSDWIDPKTGVRVNPVEGYMVIRQTMTALSMRFFSEKARSVSIAHAIECEPDGQFGFSAVYRNIPQIEYQGTGSAMHHGALLLDPHDVEPQKLRGHYWTDRGTRGTIVMDRVSAAYYPSFEDAKRALGGS